MYIDIAKSYLEYIAILIAELIKYIIVLSSSVLNHNNEVVCQQLVYLNYPIAKSIYFNNNIAMQCIEFMIKVCLNTVNEPL